MSGIPQPFVFAKRANRTSAPGKRVPIEKSLPAMLQSLSTQLGFQKKSPVVAIFDDEMNQITEIKQIKSGMTVICSNESTEKVNTKTKPFSVAKRNGTERIPVDASDESDIKPYGVWIPGDADDDFIKPVRNVKCVERDEEEVPEEEEMKMPEGQNEQNEQGDDALSVVSSATSVARRKHAQQVRDFYSAAPTIEQHIRKNIHTEVMKMFGECENEYECVHDSAVCRVRECAVMADGVAWNMNHVYAFHNAIVGPEKSGKSIFLNLFARNAYEAMLGNGQYKNTLMLCLDFAEIPKKTLESPIKFYQVIVTLILNSLFAQWPLMKQVPEKQSKAAKNYERRNKTFPVYDALMEYFMQFVNFTVTSPLTPVKLPKNVPFNSIAEQVEQIGSEIAGVLRKTNDMNPFYKTVAMLPIVLAKCFNYESVYFVVDHLDLADINVVASGTFTKKCVPISLIEYVKTMLSTGNYSLSCKNEEIFLQILEPLDDDGCDLRSSINLISMLDIETGVTPSLAELVLTLKDESDPVRLCVDDYRYPGFIALWEHIAEAVDRYEMALENGSEFMIEKARLKTLVLIRELVPLVLSFDDDVTENGSRVVDFEVILRDTE